MVGKQTKKTRPEKIISSWMVHVWLDNVDLYLYVCLKVKQIHPLPVASVQSQHIPKLQTFNLLLV